MPSTPAILRVQVVQRVAVLGEDDDLALPAAGVAHLGIVLEDLREFVPLAVLAGGDDGLGLLFEPLEDDDFRFQLGDGLRGRGLIDERSLRGSPAPRRSGRRRPRGRRRASRRGLAGRGRRASPRAGGVRAVPGGA